MANSVPMKIKLNLTNNGTLKYFRNPLDHPETVITPTQTHTHTEPTWETNTIIPVNCKLSTGKHTKCFISK